MSSYNPFQLRLSVVGLSTILASPFIVPSTPAWSAEVAGKIIISMGNNELIHADGSVEKAKTKSKVVSGDTIKTGKKGRLHIRFSDGSILSLKPNTEFKVNEYRFKPKAANNGEADYSLLKGGMRKLSGLIGKKDRSKYKVRTSVATIGIRGTSYRAALVLEDAEGALTNSLESSTPAGLYLGVDTGSVVMWNDAGEQLLQPGEFGYAASSVDVITKAIQPPPILKDDTADISSSEDSEDTDSAAETDAKDSTDDSEDNANDSEDSASNEDSSSNTEEDNSSNNAESGDDGEENEAQSSKRASRDSSDGASTSQSSSSSSQGNDDSSSNNDAGTPSDDTTELGGQTGGLSDDTSGLGEVGEFSGDGTDLPELEDIADVNAEGPEDSQDELDQQESQTDLDSASQGGSAPTSSGDSSSGGDSTNPQPPAQGSGQVSEIDNTLGSFAQNQVDSGNADALGNIQGDTSGSSSSSNNLKITADGGSSIVGSTDPTEAPTEEPTEAPTEEPTEAPTEEPTEAPTEEPTEVPTAAPTEAPTAAPTEAPTAAPTEAPTAAPTEAPTEEPTEAPTEEPTEAPTAAPTEAPTEPPVTGGGGGGGGGAPAVTTTTVAPISTSIQMSYIIDSGGAYAVTENIVTDGAGDTLTLATTPSGTSNTAYSGGGNAFTFDASSAADSNATSGVGGLTDSGKLVYWGSWTSGWQTTVEGSAETPYGAMHYIHSPDLTSVADLTAKATNENRRVVYRLNTAAGTSPTDESGSVIGNWGKGLITLDYSTTTPSLSAMDLKMALNSSTAFVISAGTPGSVDVSYQEHYQPITGQAETVCPAQCFNINQSFDGGAGYSFVGSEADRLIGSFALSDPQASGNSNALVGTFVFDQIPDNTVNYQLTFPNAGSTEQLVISIADKAQVSVIDTSTYDFDLMTLDSVGYFHTWSSSGSSLSYGLANSNSTASSDRIHWGKWSSGSWNYSLDGSVSSDADSLPLFFTSSDSFLTLDQLPTTGRFKYSPTSTGEVLLINSNDELMSVTENYFIVDYANPRVTDFSLKFSSNTDSYQYGLYSEAGMIPSTGDTLSITIEDTNTTDIANAQIQLVGDDAQRALASYSLSGSATDGAIYGVSGYQAEAATETPLAAGTPIFSSFIVDESGTESSYLLNAEAGASGDSFTIESLSQALSSGTIASGSSTSSIKSLYGNLTHCGTSGCTLDALTSGFVVESTQDTTNQIYYGRIDGNWSVVFDGVTPTHVGELHYIYSTDATTSAELPTQTGIRLYQVSGGTNPTDNLGAVGSTPNGMAIIDFDHNKVVSLDFDQSLTANWDYSGGSQSYTDTDKTHTLDIVGTSSSSTFETGRFGYSFVGSSANLLIGAYESTGASSAQSGTLVYETIPANTYDYQLVIPSSLSGAAIEHLPAGAGQVIPDIETLSPLFITYNASSNNASTLFQAQSAYDFLEQGTRGDGYIEWGYWDSASDWSTLTANTSTSAAKHVMYGVADSTLSLTDISSLSSLGAVTYKPVAAADLFISNGTNLAVINSSQIDLDLSTASITGFNLDLTFDSTPESTPTLTNYQYEVSSLPIALNTLSVTDNAFNLDLTETLNSLSAPSSASLRFAGSQAEHLLASYLLAITGDTLYGVGGYKQETIPVTGAGLTNLSYLYLGDLGGITGSVVPINSTVVDSSFNLQQIGLVGNVPVSGATTNAYWNGQSGDFTVDVQSSTLSSDGGLTSGALAMNWGYWDNTGVTLNESSTSRNTAGLHYVYSPDIIAPDGMTSMSGVIRYTLGGGTAPTDHDGTTGTLDSVQLLVDYGQQQVISLDMEITHSGSNWLAHNSGGPIPLTMADYFQNISLNGYDKGTPSTTLSGSASISFLGDTADLVGGSYQLAETSIPTEPPVGEPRGLSGAFGLHQDALTTLPDILFMPVSLDANGTESIELLNFQGKPGYISSTSEYQLPAYIDIQGNCGGGGSENCQLITHNGQAVINAGSVANLTWGYWGSGDWSIDSTTATVSGQSLPFITSPKTDTFSIGQVLRGAFYSADAATMQIAASNATASAVSSSFVVDFSAMQLMHVDVQFTGAGGTANVTNNYLFETTGPVSLISTNDSVSFSLEDQALSGTGNMMLSLVDSADDDSLAHAMSAFELSDTVNDRMFWGTTAYTLSTPETPDTAASGLQVLVGKQYSTNQAGTIAAIDNTNRVTLDNSEPVLISTKHDGGTTCTDCSVLAGSVKDTSKGDDSALTNLGVSWGRWASDEMEGSFAGADISLQQLHYIQSNNRTPDVDITNLSGTANAITAGTINYDYVNGSGSAPTDQLGNVGSYGGASMGVDFGTQQINSLNIDMTIDSKNILLESTGATTIDSVLSGGGISLQSATGSDVSSLTGGASAVFIGTVSPITSNGATISVPQGVMSSFGASNGTNSVSGALLMELNDPTPQ